MGQRNDSVQVYGLSYLIKKLESEDSLLIVDDVFDTGKSIDQIVLDLKTACKKNTPELYCTPYFKPSQIRPTESQIIIFMKQING